METTKEEIRHDHVSSGMTDTTAVSEFIGLAMFLG